MHPDQKVYRKDIDGLRAVAVALVIGFHYFPNHIQSGFIGVDVFFVISGYLITSIIIRQIDANCFSYVEFYTRRVNRIFPALLVLLTLNLVFGWYAMVETELIALGKHISASSIFLTNFALWNESGYFAAAADSKPLLHLWSLAIEEQFYILWPIMLGLASANKKYRFFAITCAIFISFFYSLYISPRDAAAAYYSPASRGWQLAIGGLIAYGENAFSKWTALSRNSLSILGLTILITGVVFIDRSQHYPGWLALFPTLGAALILAAGVHAKPNLYFLGCKPLVFIGLISYPLYLWHWVVLVWAKLILMTSNLPATWRLGLIGLSILLAVLTYRAIENPIRRRNSVSSATLLLGGMVISGLLGGALWSGAVKGRISSEGLSKIIAATKDWEYPGENFEAYRRFTDYAFYRRTSAVPKFTVFIGDSNMEQYAPRIEYAIDQIEGSQGAILATKGGCPFAIPLLAERMRDCKDKLKTIDEIIASDEVNTIVFAQAWLNSEIILRDPTALASFEARLASIPSWKKTFIILNMPTGLDFSPTNLMSGTRLTNLSYEPGQNTSIDEKSARLKFQELNQILIQAAQRHKVSVIDPFLTLCNAERCSLTDELGNPRYKDSAHLTATFSRQAAAFIDITLK